MAAPNDEGPAGGAAGLQGQTKADAAIVAPETIAGKKVHPVANMFPLLDPASDQFKKLVVSDAAKLAEPKKPKRAPPVQMDLTGVPPPPPVLPTTLIPAEVAHAFASDTTISAAQAIRFERALDVCAKALRQIGGRTKRRRRASLADTHSAHTALMTAAREVLALEAEALTA